MQSHLLWRILDDPDLPAEWHQRLFDFVLGEWATFQAVSAKFLGPREELVVRTLERYADPAFPESKKWAYLCRVPRASADPKAERALLLVGMMSPHAFTRFVAEQLMNRFFASGPLDASVQ
jgi:hypothetical protein